MISVIVPTYNRADSVMDAVNSILAQTIPVDEIIVIDDGSTDNTEEVFSKSLEKVRYFKKQNGGVSSARNFGLKAAKGDWIAFLDSDDQWARDKIERQTKLIAKTGANICGSGCSDEFGKLLDEYTEFSKPMLPDEELYFKSPNELVFHHGKCPWVQSLLVKKQLIEDAGFFDESLSVAEDTRLMYQLALKEPIAYINAPLVIVTRTRETPGLSDNIEPQIAYKRYECYVRVQSEVYWRLIDQDPRAAKVIKKNLGYFISRLAELACVLEKYHVSRKYAFEAIFRSPNFKTFSRSLSIILFPSIIRKAFLKHWKI